MPLTRKHHCFRPLRACSLPRRNSAVTSLRGQDKKCLASYVGLCNVYWPCWDTQVTSYTNTNTSHHHVVDKTPHDDNARPPLDMTCYTGIPTITQHTNRQPQAQAPRKKRHARKARHDVPFLTYLGIHGRHLISQLQVSPHLRRPNQTYAMLELLLAVVPRLLPSTNGITVCGLLCPHEMRSQLPGMRRSECM